MENKEITSPTPVAPLPPVPDSGASLGKILAVGLAGAVALGLALWLLVWQMGTDAPLHVPASQVIPPATTTADAPEEEPATTTMPAQKPPAPVSPKTTFPGLSSDDWLRGGPNPEVVLIVYTDLDCPFCARLHPSLDEIVAPYGSRVAWTLRHMPLPMHPDAFAKAVAAECVAQRLGVAAFWAFIDAAFDGEEDSATLASSFGFSSSDLRACAEGSAGAAVAREYALGSADGAGGTPFTVVLNRSGERQTVSGAVDAAEFSAVIDAALAR